MYLLILLVSLYFVFLLYAIVPSFESVNQQIEESEPISISVVVPYKNEESNLPHLIEKIICQRPSDLRIELIFIDDHSTDLSSGCLDRLNYTKLISAKNHGKKNAIREGVEAASYDWILTLDADVRLHPGFFQELESIKTDPLKMVLFPMRPIKRRGFVPAFFDLEFLALQAVGMGMAEKNKPLLSNGACLLFKKEAFVKVDKQRDDYNVPTGDDIFAMFAIANEYGNESIGTAPWISPVDTVFPSSFSRLLRQRARWISKTIKVEYFRYRIIAFLMAFVHLLPAVLMIVFFLGMFSWITIFSLIFIKLAAEWVFFGYITVKYNRRDLLFWLPLTQLLYPIYIFTLIVNGVKYRLQYSKPSLDAA
ncbi:MAG: glycosyltransferase [Bacteroidota bacterium]